MLIKQGVQKNSAMVKKRNSSSAKKHAVSPDDHKIPQLSHTSRLPRHLPSSYATPSHMRKPSSTCSQDKRAKPHWQNSRDQKVPKPKVVTYLRQRLKRSALLYSIFFPLSLPRILLSLASQPPSPHLDSLAWLLQHSILVFSSFFSTKHTLKATSAYFATLRLPCFPSNFLALSSNRR